MVARTRRTRNQSRDRWRQIGISACVLLLPPIAIGAAAYAMLPSRDEVAGRLSDMSVAEAAKAPAPGQATTPVQPVAPQPALQKQLPAPFSTGAGTGPRKDPARVGEQSSAPGREAAPTPPPVGPAQPASGPASSPAAAARSSADTQAFASAAEQGADQGADKDLARVMGPVPVHVTVLVAPNASRARDERAGSAEKGVPPSTTIEEPDLPTGAVRAGRPPRHLRKHFARHGTHRSASRDESRGEAKPRSFSLRNWLQQLGSRQRPAPQRG